MLGISLAGMDRRHARVRAGLRRASPRSLNLSAMVGDAPTQHVFVTNEEIPDCLFEETTSLNISVTYLNGTDWLSVPPSVTFGPGQVNSIIVTVNYGALPEPGVYQALIMVTITDPETGMIVSQGTIPVTVTLSGQIQDMSKCVSPRTLNLSAIVGAAPTQHVIGVNEEIPDCAVEQAFFFIISVTYLNGTGWLSVPPSVTIAPGQANTIPVTVSYAALPGPGVYQALIILSFSEPDPETGLTDQATIPVAVTLSESRARLSLSRTAFLFQVVRDGPALRARRLRVYNPGIGTLNWSLSGLRE